MQFLKLSKLSSLTYIKCDLYSVSGYFSVQVGFMFALLFSSFQVTGWGFFPCLKSGTPTCPDPLTRAPSVFQLCGRQDNQQSWDSPGAKDSSWLMTQKMDSPGQNATCSPGAYKTHHRVSKQPKCTFPLRTKLSFLGICVRLSHHSQAKSTRLI